MKLFKYFLSLFVVSVCTAGFWPRNEVISQTPKQATAQAAAIPQTQEKENQIIKILDSSKTQNEREIMEHKQNDDAREAELKKATRHISELEAQNKKLIAAAANSQKLLLKLKADYLAAQETDSAAVDPEPEPIIISAPPDTLKIVETKNVFGKIVKRDSTLVFAKKP